MLDTMVHQLALPTDPNVGSNGAGFLAQMYRLVKGTAALIRNAGGPAYKIHREGSVVQADHRAKSWGLVTPLSDQREGDLALDAQVKLWIERNSSNSNGPAQRLVFSKNVGSTIAIYPDITDQL